MKRLARSFCGLWLFYPALLACNQSTPPNDNGAASEPSSKTVAEASEAGIPDDCEHVSGEQARKLVAEGATLLDVRTPQEYRQEHVDGAMLIPHDEVGQRLDEIPKNEPVVTYCKSGRRAGIAAEALRDHGYTAYNMGGLDDWDTTGNDCK